MTKKFLFITNNAEYQYSMRSQLFDLRDSYVQNKKKRTKTLSPVYYVCYLHQLIHANGNYWLVQATLPPSYVQNRKSSKKR